MNNNSCISTSAVNINIVNRRSLWKKNIVDMKGRMIWWIVLACVACFFVACHRPAEETYRVGVSQCSGGEWRDKMNDEILREAMFHDGVSVEIRNAEDNSDRQADDVRYFIDNGFDIILISPNDAETLSGVLDEAMDKGIPVVTFDREIKGGGYTAHIEVDNEAIGSYAGKYVASVLPSGGKIIEIQGTPGMSPAVVSPLLQHLPLQPRLDRPGAIRRGEAGQGDRRPTRRRSAFPERAQLFQAADDVPSDSLD